jgi:hypothetical protein
MTTDPSGAYVTELRCYSYGGARYNPGQQKMTLRLRSEQALSVHRSVAGAVNETHVYDGDGVRVKMTAGGTATIYPSTELMEFRTASISRHCL